MSADQRASACTNRGATYLSRNDIGHALQDFDQAIALHPSCVSAWIDRGNAYLRKRDYRRARPSAIRDYDQAVALKPDFACAFHNRALAVPVMRRHPQS